MSIFSDAEHDEIKQVFAEMVADELFVAGGVLFDVSFCFHPKDLLRRDGNTRKAVIHGHAVITVGVIGRTASLIAPKEPYFCPVDGAGCSHLLIDRFRR